MADQSFLDWPFFEPHHKTLAQELDQWAAATLPAIVDREGAHSDLDGTCRKLVKALGDGGWLTYCVPAAYGGALEEFDVRTLCLTREALAYHSGLADFAFAMQGLGTGSISLFGTDEVKQKYLPDVATGKRLAAFAMSEADGGSDVAAMKTTAEVDGNHFVLNGAKTWISNAGIADQYVVFARTGEAPGAKGLSAFVVDADTPGLEVSERIDVIAPHPLGSLQFTDCRVPAGNLLANPGDGFPQTGGTSPGSPTSPPGRNSSIGRMPGPRSSKTPAISYEIPLPNLTPVKATRALSGVTVSFDWG